MRRCSLILMWALALCFARFGSAEDYTISTVAGVSARLGSIDGVGTAAQFNTPNGVALDSHGNAYVTDISNHTIRKITPSGVVTTFAGLRGVPGSTDGDLQTARFNAPANIVFDANDVMYVADTNNHTIRKIDTNGMVTTVAGTAGVKGGADGVGAAASFNNPYGIAVDAVGALYVTELSNFTVRKIAPDGTVSTLAGLAGTSGAVDGVGSLARFAGPTGVAVTHSGLVVVCDWQNNNVQTIAPDGTVTTIAGSAVNPAGYADGDGANARFNQPWYLALDAADNIYVADAGNNNIRKVTLAGTVTTVAGSGIPGAADGPAPTAQFCYPNGICVDPSNNIYVADTSNNEVRFISAGGSVSTIAGVSPIGSNDGPAATARFITPSGVVADGLGNVYIADTGNNAIRKLDAAGNVSTLAGSPGIAGSSDGPGPTATFNGPVSITIDGNFNLYVADNNSHTIRKIAPSGNVSTLAGIAGQPGSADGMGLQAQFNNPVSIAADFDGTVYVADANNFTVRKISPSGMVSTLAGLAGVPGSSNGIGAAARFNVLTAVATNGTGNVVAASNASIRTIAPDGTVATLAGSPGHQGTADGTGAQARFSPAGGLVVDTQGNIFVTQYYRNRIRKVTPTGVVTTIAGGSGGGSDGTGSAAQFRQPAGITIDSGGSLYIADSNNNVIRKGVPALADIATIDVGVGTVNSVRQLDTNPQSATAWSWYIAAQPAGSVATLSSTSVRNPTFVPDYPGSYEFRCIASGPGGTSNSTVTLTAQDTPVITAVTVNGSTVNAPITKPSGSTLALSVQANDPGMGQLTYTWATTGGTFDTPNQAAANLVLGVPGTYTVSVTVTNQFGISSTASITVIDVVAISTITPSAGSTLGGTLVIISGSGFQSGATVTFGGVASVDTPALNEDGTIACTTPPGLAGAVDVIVTNPDSQSGTLPQGFTYVTPPVISGPFYVGGAIGTPFSYTLNVANNPDTVSAMNLPDGLTFSAGVISGVPTTPGTFNVPVSATNGGGTTNGTVTITIIFDAVANVYPPIIQGDILAVALDNQGNRYVAGIYSGTIDFNPGVGADVKSAPVTSATFVSRFNADGSYAWTQTFDGSTGYATATGIAVSGSTVYVTGSFQGSNYGIEGRGSFSGGTDPQSSSAFVLALDATSGIGVATFGIAGVQTFGGSNGFAAATGIAVSGTTIYLTGSFGGSNLGLGGSGNIITNSGSAFVLAINAVDGTGVPGFGISGIQTFGGSQGSASGQGIAVSGSSVYVTGSFSGSNFGLGGSGVTSAFSNSTFILAVNASDAGPVPGFGNGGVQVFSGPTGFLQAQGIAVLGTTVYVTGYLLGPNFSAFVLAVNTTDGTAVQGFGNVGIQTFGGLNGAAFGQGIAAFGTTVYLSGVFYGSNYGLGGSGNISFPNGSAGYVLALDSSTGAAEASFGRAGVQMFGGSGPGVYNSQVAASQSIVYSTGYFAGAGFGLGGAGSYSTAGGFSGFLLPLDATTGHLYAPEITSPLNLAGASGDPFTYTIQANHNPTSYAALNLPAGLTLNDNVISGRLPSVPPGETVLLEIPLQATNYVGTGSAVLRIFVVDNAVANAYPPVIQGQPFAVTVDGQGNRYVAGSFSNPHDFDPGVGTDVKLGPVDLGESFAFVTRFNADGSYGWTQTFGGTGTTAGARSLTVSNGVVYATGFVTGQNLGIGGSGTLSSQNQCAFVIALSSVNGSAVSGFGFNGVQVFSGSSPYGNGPGYASGAGIVVSNGAVFIVGSFTGKNAGIGGSGILVSENQGYNSSAFVMALDAVTGTAANGFGQGGAQRLGSAGIPYAGYSYGTGISAADNEVFITGYFTGQNFGVGGTGAVSSSSAQNSLTFVAALNSIDGSAASFGNGGVETFGSSLGYSHGAGIATAGNDVYVTGDFYGAGAGIGGSGTLGTPNSWSAFVLSLNAQNGSPAAFGLNNSGIQTFSGNGVAFGQAIAVAGNQVFATGTFDGWSFGIGGPMGIASPSSQAVFILSLDAADGSATPFGFHGSGVQIFGGPNSGANVLGIAASSDTVYTTGTFNGSNVGVGGSGSNSNADSFFGFLLGLDMASGGQTQLVVPDATAVYGATATLSATLTPAKSGKAISFSVDGVAFGSATTDDTGTAIVTHNLIHAAGTATVTAIFAGDASLAQSTATGILTITPAPLTVTADNESKVYGSPIVADGTYGGTLTGVVAGDNITATFYSVADATTPVGFYGTNSPYAVIPTLSGPLTNYNVTVVNGTMTVTPAPLTVTANDASRTYGTANPTFTGLITGLLNNDNITASYASAANGTTPVGTYGPATPQAIMPTLVDPNGLLANYAVSTTNGALTIVPAAPVITWNNPTNIVYGTALDGTQLNATANTPGTFVYSPPTGTVLHAGFAQSLSVTFTPTDTVNFTSTTASVAITVNPKALTITADDKSRLFGQPNPQFTVTYSGFANGDNAQNLQLSPQLSTVADQSSLPGIYPITFDSALSFQDISSLSSYGSVFGPYVDGSDAYFLGRHDGVGDLLKWNGSGVQNLTNFPAGSGLFAGPAKTIAGTTFLQVSSNGVADLCMFSNGIANLSNFPPGSNLFAALPVLINGQLFGSIAGPGKQDVYQILNGTFINQSNLPVNSGLQADLPQSVNGEFLGFIHGSLVKDLYDIVNGNYINLTNYPGGLGFGLTLQLPQAVNGLTLIAIPNPNQQNSDLYQIANGNLINLTNFPVNSGLYASDAKSINGQTIFEVESGNPPNLTFDIYQLLNEGTCVNLTNLPVNYFAFYGPPVSGEVYVQVLQNLPSGNEDLYQLVNGTLVNLTSFPPDSRYYAGYPQAVNGETLVTIFTQGKNDLYQILNGSLVNLTNFPPYSLSAGNVVALNGQTFFTVSGQGKQDLYQLSGTTPINLTNFPPNSGLMANPPWLSGTQIFVSINNKNAQDLYELVNGTVINLTNFDPSMNSYASAIVLDGFEFVLLYGQGKTDLCQLTNGSLVNLTNFAPNSGAMVSLPQAIGGQILGSISDQGNQDIYEVFNGVFTNLSNFPPNSGAFAQQPQLVDGQIFVRVHNQGNIDLYRIENHKFVNLSNFTPETGQVALIPQNVNGELIARIGNTIQQFALADYSITSVPGTLTILPALTWAVPADIVYGTPLGATQLDADAQGVPGTFTYTPPVGTFLNAGQSRTLSVTFTPNDTSIPPSTATTTINVLPATPVIAWNNPSAIVYGTALDVTQLNAAVTDPATGLPVAGTFTYTPDLGTVLSAGSGQVLSVSFSASDANFDPTSASANVRINVSPAQLNVFADHKSFHYGNPVPPLTLTPIGLVNGDTLAGIGVGASLHTWATSSTLPGTYVLSIFGFYGIVPNYNVTFYDGTIDVTNTLPIADDQTVNINENAPATPITLTATDADGDPLTWQIVWYPTAGTLTGTPPNMIYTPAPNDFGTHHFGFEVFDPAGAAMNPTQPSNVADVTITINHTAPFASFTINPSPAAIGKPVTFDATAATNTDGPSTALTFTWNFGDGSAQVVTTTPQTTHTYATSTTFRVKLTVTDTLGATGAVTNSVTVYPANPVITWGNPAGITYPKALSATQLNAKANVPGTFVYNPPTGTILHAGNAQPLTVTFTPTDNVTFNTVSKTVKINVAKGTPSITWAPPALTWPTPFGSLQENATTTAIGGGTFSYSITAGTVISPPNASCTVTLTPNDLTDYKTNTLTKTITVNKFTPVFAWAPATPITYPAALDGTELNATFGDAFGVTLAGTATYTPTVGTILTAGTHALKVSFTPTDTVHYNSLTNKSVNIVVSKGTPTVTWNNPAPITFGTKLSATQLDATASVPGTLVYTPAAGTTLAKGTHTLSVKLTPTDTNYNTVTKTVTIVVQ